VRGLLRRLAQVIGALNLVRWQVELFFERIKRSRHRESTWHALRFADGRLA